jgi:hypothetical protein
MDKTDAATRPIASLLCGLTLLSASLSALPQSRVYRCTSPDGAVEFSQRPCKGGVNAEALDIQDQRTGWVPPKPEPEPPTNKRKKRTKSEKQSNRDKYAERCWKKRQQVKSINNELRAGYSPARGERLKKRRREHEAFISEYCR